MTTAIKTLILIVLLAIVACVLIAFLLFYLFERFQKKWQDLVQQKPRFNKTNIAGPVSNVLLMKPNVWKDDVLETLLENHKNEVTLENNKQSSEQLVLKDPDTDNVPIDSIVEEQKQLSEPDIPTEPEIINQENAPKVGEIKKYAEPSVYVEQPIKNGEMTRAGKNQTETLQSDFINELEINLAIATTPWANKLISFKTRSWDTNRGAAEPTALSHFQELIQLYIDIDLANNVVWLATEMNHRSKELDESYIKLCSGIAERIQKIMQSNDQQNPVQLSIINTTNSQFEPIALPPPIQRTKKRVTRKSTSLKKK